MLLKDVYKRQGQDVVDKNFGAVDRGGEYKQLTVDPAWANLADDEAKEEMCIRDSYYVL